MKTLFYMFALSTILLAIGYGSTLGSQGMMRVALIPIIVSPIMMLVVRYGWEHGQPNGLLDPRTQSWAFLFGDTIMLPIALGAAAFSWRTLPSEGWHRSTWWFLLSLGVGVVFALVFHFVLNAPNYINAGNGDMMGSPTSLWHDVVVYEPGNSACVPWSPGCRHGLQRHWVDCDCGTGWLACHGRSRCNDPSVGADQPPLPRARHPARMTRETVLVPIAFSDQGTGGFFMLKYATL